MIDLAYNIILYTLEKKRKDDSFIARALALALARVGRSHPSSSSAEDYCRYETIDE